MEELSASIFRVCAVHKEQPYQKIYYTGNGNWNSEQQEWWGDVVVGNTTEYAGIRWLTQTGIIQFWDIMVWQR